MSTQEPLLVPTPTCARCGGPIQTYRKNTGAPVGTVLIVLGLVVVGATSLPLAGLPFLLVGSVVAFRSVLRHRCPKCGTESPEVVTRMLPAPPEDEE